MIDYPFIRADCRINHEIQKWNKKAMKQLAGFVEVTDHANRRDNTHHRIIITIRQGKIYYQSEER